MARTTRSRNFSLLRWHYCGNDGLAKVVASVVTNKNYVSKMCRGEMEITDWTARRIESVLALPDGWLDRDTVGMIKMSTIDWEVHTKMAVLPDAAKSSLLGMISAIQQQPVQTAK